MSDKSNIETVLGISSVRLHGWGRDPVSSSSTMGATKKSKCLAYEDLVDAYDELVEELGTMKGKCAIMEQALIENNIMPRPSSILEQSQCDTLEGVENIDE
ncbi:hypothetical protein HanPSC8_Chr12g0526271 [Helianthus annuus]|nr:hypothetical protein HanPSC8_Chr12g0526271 [Helianthus annuus]